YGPLATRLLSVLLFQVVLYVLCSLAHLFAYLLGCVFHILGCRLRCFFHFFLGILDTGFYAFLGFLEGRFGFLTQLFRFRADFITCFLKRIQCLVYLLANRMVVPIVAVVVFRMFVVVGFILICLVVASRKSQRAS